MYALNCKAEASTHDEPRTPGQRGDEPDPNGPHSAIMRGQEAGGVRLLHSQFEMILMLSCAFNLCD